MFNNIPLSHNQKQLILGSLLGDGYCNRERQFLRFSQCLKQKEYLDYKYSFFNENETSKIYERLYKEGYVSYSFEFYNKNHIYDSFPNKSAHNYPPLMFTPELLIGFYLPLIKAYLNPEVPNGVIPILLTYLYAKTFFILYVIGAITDSS